MTFNCRYWYFKNFDALSSFSFKSFSKICCSKNLFDRWWLVSEKFQCQIVNIISSFAKINFCWPTKFEIFNSWQIFWKMENKILPTLLNDILPATVEVFFWNIWSTLSSIFTKKVSTKYFIQKLVYLTSLSSAKIICQKFFIFSTFKSFGK